MPRPVALPVCQNLHGGRPNQALQLLTDKLNEQPHLRLLITMIPKHNAALDSRTVTNIVRQYLLAQKSGRITAHLWATEVLDLLEARSRVSDDDYCKSRALTTATRRLARVGIANQARM